MSLPINHVLVVDDDRKIRSLLVQFMVEEGFFVSAAEDAKQAREQMKKFEFDLLIVDVMMPGESGLSFTEKVKTTHTTPVLMLTAMGEVEDRIKGLEHGADDYLPKPFEPRELLLRARKLIDRHRKNEPKDSVHFGPYQFNLKNHRLTKGQQSIALTTNEEQLLEILIAHKGKPVSRETLAENCGGINERSVDVQMTRLRNKIESDPKQPMFIKTMRGKGYVFL